VFRSDITIPEGTYVELVQSLFRTLLPTSIIAISFTAVATRVSLQMPDPGLIALTILGSTSVAARIVILLLFRREAAQPELSVARARELERIFAVSYLCFAAIFGMFSAWALVVAPQGAHALVIALLVGYAAGVAAGIAYRPWISVSAMLLGVLPTIAVSFASGDFNSWAVGAVLAIFLAGGIQNIVAHYRFASGGITRKRLFADMAEHDVLTGLANRFGLGERFNEATKLGRDSGDIAVHCLDLDRFKPVNDKYGHPVGDIVLKAVADRLSNTLRGNDFAARVGGDEFVIVQIGIRDATEADLLARRIVRVIAEPYGVGNLTITIGVSIGFVLLSGHGPMLDKLIAHADEALLRAKAAGGACARSGQNLQLTG
jgi:diguanylate cyclase (GGDEF)-like protein